MSTTSHTPNPRTTNTEIYSQIQIESLFMKWGIQLSHGKGKPSVQIFKLDTRTQLMTRLMVVSFNYYTGAKRVTDHIWTREEEVQHT